MIDLNLIISIFTLNLNIVNTPKRQGLDKKDPNICCLKEMYSNYKDKDRLEGKGEKKIHHANSNQKKALTSKWEKTSCS